MGSKGWAQRQRYAAPRERAGIPAPAGSPFDALASDYDAWFEDEGKLIFAIEVEGFREVLPALPKPWLEVGVGSGRFARALGIENGIDPSVNLLKMAREREVATFLSRGENSPFHNGVFGTVFLIATLCFVQSPLAVLRESRRILQAEGRIALGLVLRDSPWGQFYLMKKASGNRFYKFSSFYTHKELEDLLRHTGFTVKNTISTLFQKPNEVREMETPREGFSPNAGFTVVTAQKAPGQSQDQDMKSEQL